MGTWMNFALVALLMLVVTNLIFAESEKESTLFSRIGGHAGIESVVKQFLMYLNSSIHFNKINNELISERFYQHMVDFFSIQTGGPHSYLGNSLDFITDTILISDSDWILICCIFEETLRGQINDEEDIHQLINIFVQLRNRKEVKNQNEIYSPIEKNSNIRAQA